MKRVRYDLMIKIGNTLRIERVDDIDSKIKGYQKLRIIEEGEEWPITKYSTGLREIFLIEVHVLDVVNQETMIGYWPVWVVILKNIQKNLRTMGEWHHVKHVS